VRRRGGRPSARPYRRATAAAFPFGCGRADARIPAKTVRPSTRSGIALTERAAGILDLELIAPAGTRASLDISRIPLPPRLRPAARLGVLDITEFFGDTTGGVRTYLLEKARYVQRRPELRQTIVVPGARDEILESSGVRCYRLRGPSVPTQKPYRFMLATRSTSRIVAHEQPNLIEVGSAWFAPWLVHLATRQFSVPAVWYYHSNFPRILAPRHLGHRPFRRAAAALAWSYVRRLARMVRVTLAPSRTVVRELEAAGIENVIRVPLGVNLELFHPGRRAHADDTRSRFGLPQGPLALYVGRFAAEKEVSLLLSAWPEVERRTGAKLVLVGDGPARAALRASTGGQGAIWLAFERDRDRLADLFAAVDFCVSPGSLETFGLAAIEAFASGTPVLTADAGGVAENVELSGAGRLFAARDPGSLAAEAIGLMQSDLRALGAKGRSHAEIHHGWDTVFDGLFTIYRGIVDA
jgi:alpha-1,6-mannosyltransferase